MKLKKHQLLPLLLGGAVLFLLILYFALVRPLTRPQAAVTTAVTTNDGEGLIYNQGSLYPQISRSNMRSITVHNENGTYRFARVAPEGQEVTNRHQFIIFTEKDGEFTDEHAHVAYNEERFSELVVATGSFYYLRNLGTDPDLMGQPLNLSDYGLAEEDDPAWFEIDTFSSGKVRVYVGDPAVTENGYYVRVAGRDTVYVSNSNLVGETALKTLPSFVDATLTSPFASLGYYYNKDFSLYKTAPAGYAVAGEDYVYYRYHTVIDGTVSESMQGGTNLRHTLTEEYTAFLGKTTDSAPFSYSITYPDEERYEKLRGKTVEYCVEAIERIQSLYVALDFLNVSQRNDFHSGVAYTITAPETKRGYLPHSSHYMGILESIGALVGTETVAIGIDNETIEKYGLREYYISYWTPESLSYDTDNPDDVVAGGYMPIYLYVSAKQPDGSYYVGSVLTGIVAKVDGSTMAFLEHPDSWWLEDTMFTVNITNTAKLEFAFRYNDLSARYTFHMTQREVDGTMTTTEVFYAEGGRPVNVDAFKNFYLHLVTIYYSGEYDGEVPVSEVLLGQSVLEMTVTMQDNEVYTYRFYPYSGRHVLVSVSAAGGAEGAFFYALAPEVEKIYRDIATLISGGNPDPEKQY